MSPVLGTSVVVGIEMGLGAPVSKLLPHPVTSRPCTVVGYETGAVSVCECDEWPAAVVHAELVAQSSKMVPLVLPTAPLEPLLQSRRPASDGLAATASENDEGHAVPSMKKISVWSGSEFESVPVPLLHASSETYGMAKSLEPTPPGAGVGLPVHVMLDAVLYALPQPEAKSLPVFVVGSDTGLIVWWCTPVRARLVRKGGTSQPKKESTYRPLCRPSGLGRGSCWS